MGYSSEEFYEKENRILKENEYSKRKHQEVEERYKDLVEKKPLSVDLEESLAILQEVYANKNGEPDLKGRFHLSAESFSLEENFEIINELQEKQNCEKDSEAQNEADSVGVEENEDKNGSVGDCRADNLSEEAEKVEKDTVNFPEDGVFKAFYEDNIAPMLERPDFKEIRDFINNGNDFSDEKYEMMVKAFEEKTGIIYSNVGAVINNEKKYDNEGINEEEVSDKERAEELSEQKELSYDDFMDGAKKMQAIPVKNEKENSEDKMGRLFVGSALSGIVALIVIFILYSVW